MFPDITVGNWQLEQMGVLTEALQTAHELNATQPEKVRRRGRQAGAQQGPAAAWRCRTARWHS